MSRVVVRRLVELAVVFLGVTFLIFAAVYALPGDPIRAMAGERVLPQTVVDALRTQYHLDDPLGLQYLRYLGSLLTGDLGTDFNGRSVSDQMAARWPVTIRLALTAWVIEIVLGLGLGVFLALRSGRWTTSVVLWVGILLTSVPVFVLGYVGQLWLGVRWDVLPIAGSADGWPVSYLMPATTIAVLGMVVVARITRGSVLDNLRSDHVRTAHAKGLSSRQVFVRHVLRNSLVPVVTFLAVDLGALLGGAVIVEGIFNLPGVGLMLFEAVRDHQGPVVVGVSTALVLIFLLVNVVADLLVTALDPRIRLG